MISKIAMVHLPAIAHPYGTYASPSNLGQLHSLETLSIREISTHIQISVCEKRRQIKSQTNYDNVRGFC
jgi:hypothetical protein